MMLETHVRAVLPACCGMMLVLCQFLLLKIKSPRTGSMLRPARVQVSPTFPSTVPHVYQLCAVRDMTSAPTASPSPSSYTFCLSACAIQPHDTRFFSRGTIQRCNLPCAKSTCLLYLNAAAPFGTVSRQCHRRSNSQEVYPEHSVPMHPLLRPGLRFRWNSLKKPHHEFKLPT